MIFELRTYLCRPGKAPEYLDRFRREGVGHVTRHLPMLGYWLAETGPLNAIVHLWAYASLEERDACRATLAADAAWTQGFVPAAFENVVGQVNRLLHLERGSRALDAAVADRRRDHSNRDTAEPMYAPGLMTLTVAPRPPASADVALWRTVAGEGCGGFVALSAGADLDLPDEPCDRTLLRPLALSPLR